MEVYLVGGAVRDQLLDLPVEERDWLVVGATPQQMIDKGFNQVTSGFPVFIHTEPRYSTPWRIGRRAWYTP